MKKKISLIAVVIIVVIALALGAWLIASHRSGKGATKQPAGSTASKYTHLDITLKNGHLVQPAATYLVKPGTTLEFGITSNVLGKVSVPTTDPPQIISFTQSPLVFHFTVSKPGSYPLGYQANDGSDAIQIGTIVVRSDTDK